MVGERVGRDDGLEVTSHEPVLHFLAIGRRSLPVIEADPEFIHQHFVKPLRFLHRRDVDHPRSLEFTKRVSENGVLDRIVDGTNHLEAQIRSRESGDGDVRLDHSQLADDVRLHVLGGRGSERQNRWTTESL